MPTIEDVAREAGVGIGSVSRVLNGGPYVSDALRERVLAAIERLGYRPSPVARAFGARRTRTIELLVPLFMAPCFLQALRGIEEGLSGSHYALLVRTIQDAGDRDRAFEECCRRGQSDGALVLWLTPPSSFFERLTLDPVPAVLLNVTADEARSVGVDHDASARDAVDYCIRIGHRRIALVDRAIDAFDPASHGLCVDGYRQALLQAGLPRVKAYEQKADFSQMGGAMALQTFLEQSEPPTAVVAASEVQAIGIVLAARDRGWRVPGDLSVVGYSDSQYSEYLGLTTIGVPVQDIGREATRMLLAALADPASAPQSIFRPTELLVRATCGPPRS